MDQVKNLAARKLLAPRDDHQAKAHRFLDHAVGVCNAQVIGRAGQKYKRIEQPIKIVFVIEEVYRIARADTRRRRAVNRVEQVVILVEDIQLEVVRLRHVNIVHAMPVEIRQGRGACLHHEFVQNQRFEAAGQNGLPSG